MDIRVASALTLIAIAAVITALAVWWGLAKTEPASARQVLQTACGQLANAGDYDVTISVTGSTAGEAWPAGQIAARFSGDDYEIISTVAGETFSYIRVAGTSYRKWQKGDFVGEWRTIHDPTRDIRTVLGLDELGATPACPTLDGLVNAGQSSAAGQSATKFTAASGPTSFDDVASTFVGQMTSSQHQYWVGAQGQLLRHVENRKDLHGSGNGTNLVVTNMDATFSGVGEANVITAPTVGE